MRFGFSHVPVKKTTTGFGIDFFSVHEMHNEVKRPVEFVLCSKG